MVLREIADIKQGPADICKRWFSSDAMDLVVWLDQCNGLVAFHLCYDKAHSEHAIVWRGKGKVLAHHSVDDGESEPGKYKASPILTEAKKLPLKVIREKLLLESSELPPVILADVLARLDTGEAIDWDDL
jgi:hypothetical protein